MEDNSKPAVKVLTVKRIFIVHSPYSYLSRSIDLLFDKVFWSWTGQWSDELEASLAKLLISIEDDLKETAERMAPLSKAFGISDFSRLIESATENMVLAMAERSALGIGQLHSIFYQFLEMGNLLQVMIPKSLIECVKDYEIVKWKHSDQREVIRLASCVKEAYFLMWRGGLASEHDKEKLRNLTVALENDGERFQLAALHDLKPSMRDIFGGADSNFKSVKAHPILNVDECLTPTNLDKLVENYTEILVGNVLMLGSMLGYSIGNNTEESILIMNNILYAGFGYVTTPDGRMLPTINQNRAALLLGYNREELSSIFGLIPQKRIKKRYKDVTRIWRKNSDQDGAFSLRVSTDFDTALKGLLKHHRDAWVGPKLEEIWKVMFSRKDLVTVELWHEEKMIAADFGHPTGKSVYIATRWYDRSYRKYAPGFALALLSAQYFQKLGFHLWDLGGTDGSPMMSYKKDVSFTFNRQEFMYHFLAIRDGIDIPPTAIKRGIVLEVVNIDDMFSIG